MKAFIFDVTGGSPYNGEIVVVALRKDSALREAKRVIDVWNEKWFRGRDGAVRYSLVSEDPTTIVWEIGMACVVHAFSGEA